MAYCAQADVTNAGGTGAGAALDAAIAEATERINAYTDDVFETATLTLIAAFGRNGVAPLPRRVQSVTSVTFLDSNTLLDSSAYRVRSSGSVGDIDAIELVGTPFFDADGFLNRVQPSWPIFSYARRSRRISVVAVAGPATVPLTIKTACAKLAAWLTQTPTFRDDLGHASLGIQSLAVEGYSVTFAPPAAGKRATTGNEEIDRLLKGFRREAGLVG